MRKFLFFLILLGLAASIMALGTVGLARRSYGPAAANLGPLRVLRYSARLMWDDGLLTTARAPGAPEQTFEVSAGESVEDICARLQAQGLISDAATLKDYLIYSGRDMTIQAGRYNLSAGMSMLQIAERMQDATPSDVNFVVLPGWRMEEVAASLPTSGLEIAPEAFLAAARMPPVGYELLAGAPSVEGFLYPDSYTVPRTTSAHQLIDALISNFANHLSPEIQNGFRAQGLSTYQAVTLASIVARESVRDEEAPMIASVYLNRLHAAMKLDADPTVQYALGFNATQQTWWTNPLSGDDLKVASPYNTYQTGGLPPSPISNPGITALRAVAFPVVSPYFFFSSRCDGSGFHDFAETFDEHLRNLCP